jgi:hypothetical protein
VGYVINAERKNWRKIIMSLKIIDGTPTALSEWLREREKDTNKLEMDLLIKTWNMAREELIEDVKKMIDKSKKFSSYTKLKILNLLKELEKE